MRTTGLERILAPAFLLALATAVLPGCGGDEGAGIEISESDSETLVGPPAEALAAALEDMLFDHWKVTAFARKKTIEEGDAVQPVVRGRFEATVARREDGFTVVESLGAPGTPSRRWTSSRPAAGGVASGGDDRTLVVERVGREGEALELYGVYVSQFTRDSWKTVFTFELEGGASMPPTTDIDGIMRRVLGADRPLSAFSGAEVIVKGSEREAAFREARAAEERRLEEAARREREERQEAARREREAREEAARARRREELAAFTERLLPGREYLGRAEFPRNDDEISLTLTRVDPETGRVEGTTTRVAHDGHTYTRPLSGTVERGALRLQEGKDLGEPSGRYPSYYDLRLDASGALAITWGDRSARGRKVTLDPRPAAEVRAERNRVVATLAAGRTYRGTSINTRSEAVAVTLEVTAVDTEAGTLTGSIHWDDPHVKQDMKRACTGRTHLGTLWLAEGEKLGGSGSWGQYPWSFELAEGGEALTGIYHVHGSGNPRRPVTLPLAK